MIQQNELAKAIELAKKYGVGKLFLFGSALYKAPEEINDYDFAVLDFPPGIFFRFYGVVSFLVQECRFDRPFGRNDQVQGNSSSRRKAGL